MYELSVKSHFSAAHRLPGYDGSCASVHGHNWEVEVFVRGEQIDESGLLMDFRALKREVRAAMAVLDHKDLNEVEAFGDRVPSSEHIARFLYERLAGKLNNERCRISRVRVGETPESFATYWETEQPS